MFFEYLAELTLKYTSLCLTLQVFSYSGLVWTNTFLAKEGHDVLVGIHREMRQLRMC